VSSPTAKPYSPVDWPQLDALLEAWPFKPLAGYGAWPAENLLDLTRSRVENVLRDAQVVTWVPPGRGETVLGLAALSGLPWDSKYLGLKAARLDYLIASGSYARQYEVKRLLLTEALAQATAHGIQHISARLNASDLSGLHVLEQAGFITVDGILTFTMELANCSITSTDGDMQTRVATTADADVASDLARDAYRHDRFHSDPAITTEQADELYAAWIRNSCAGIGADSVIVAEDGQSLLGYVTCKLQSDTKAHLGKLIGTIGLVATAAQARGRGIARAATLAALRWFQQQGADIVEVGTQLRNIPASRLYQSCGFRLIDSSISLRKLL